MKTQLTSLSFIFFAAITILSISACTSSQITSNKSPEFKEKLSKVYLIIKSEKRLKQFTDLLKTSLLKSFPENEIESACYIIDPLSLEGDQEINERIIKFSPQVVMVISQTESRRDGPGNNTYLNPNKVVGGTFDVKLLLPNSQKIVWRASLEVSGSSGIEWSVKKAVNKLIEKLKADGLI